MSQYPPPIDPLPYASPPIPVPPRRPTTVTVVAIIAIVWGGIATLLRLCAVPQLVYMQVSPNPMMNGFRNDAVLVALQIASLVIGLGLGILLLSGGILSLSLKPLGRTFLIVYA